MESIEMTDARSSPPQGERFRRGIPGMSAAGVAGVPGDAVEVRIDTVPESLPGGRSVAALVEAKPGAALLRIDGIGRFLVREGREVIVEPAPEARAEAIRLFLSGPVAAALLLERGLFPLHASAIVAQGEIVAFLAPSGGGKSALAASLEMRGFEVWADDILPVRLDGEGRPIASPGVSSVKLWEDTIAALGIDRNGWRRVRPELEKYERIEAREERPSPPADALPVRRLLVLRDDRSRAADRAGALEAFLPLRGMERLRAILEHTYARALVEPLGRLAEHFRIGSALASHAEIDAIVHPRGLEHLESLTDRVVGWIERPSQRLEGGS